MNKLLLLALVLTSLFTMPAAQASGIEGDTINITFYAPDTSTVYSNLGDQVVSTGGALFNMLGISAILVTANSITVNNFASDGYFAQSPFEGFIVTDLTKNFASAYSVDSANNLAGLTNSQITTLGKTVLVNLSGLSFNTNTTASMTSPVPEPKTYGMMLGGLGLMGFMMRRNISIKFHTGLT